MRSLVFLVCCLVFDLTQANDQCWCTDSDMTMLKAPTHSAITVDVLTSGSCLNTSQFEHHGPWIQIKTTEKSGFVHHANGVNLKDCPYAGLLKRATCPSHCMDHCCVRAGTHHYHTSDHAGHGCDTCDSTCCDPVQTSQHGGHTDNSEWSLYGDCSVTCGEGTQTRYCTNHCNHDTQYEIRVCREQDCPPEWSDWSPCSASCGGGHMVKHCLHYCHLDVNHPNGEIQTTCNTNPCPVDGQWSSWSSASCSVTCGTGTTIRHRTCTSPPPSNNGAYCSYSEHGSSMTVTCVEASCQSVNRCDKFGTIQALAEQNVTSQVHCPDRWNSGTENFVHTHCHNAPSDIKAWHQGESVLTDCMGSKVIQSFTPIGTFSQFGYEQGGHSGISGIFLSCTPRGFKMATKACDGGAEIIDIPHDTSAILSSDAIISNNPSSYYTIKW
ncbi:SCO-spondin-like [Mizuhopecten yessoensis]|uniref:Hemicentin-1 n=1 Tax=Mizuhopecten yessoensis TaxID=6573 RepID=A0A210Q5Z3_MIZYE|nr:SCO-spondin-like [Mizuhopecten yessoensis]OWF44141.1 Hemicentin-1 [Mizuhopecten yessoensis]